MATRVRRKPAPKLDDDALSVLSFAASTTPTLNDKRHSFALYPDPLPTTPVSPTSSSTGHAHSPHYTTRRRAQSSANSLAASAPPPIAIPKSQSMATTQVPPAPAHAPRTRLARLLLPHSHSHSFSTSPSTAKGSKDKDGNKDKDDAPGIRKHTISIPTPVAQMPAGMVPPELAAFARAQRPVALRDLPLGSTSSATLVPPPLKLVDAAHGLHALPLVSPTSSTASRSSDSSGSSSSRASGETMFTSPPLSPLSPTSPLSPASATKSAVVNITSPRVLPSPTSITFADASSPLSPSFPHNANPTSPPRNPNRTSPKLEIKLETEGKNTNPKKPPPLPALQPPTPAALRRALALPLVAPSGVRVRFGDVLGVPVASSFFGGEVVGKRDGEDVEQNEPESALHTEQEVVEPAEGEVKPKRASRFIELLPPPSPPPSPTTKTRRTLVIFLRHFWCPLCQDYMVALGRGVRGVVDAEEEGKRCAVCAGGGGEGGGGEEEMAYLEGLVASGVEGERERPEHEASTYPVSTASSPAFSQSEADADAGDADKEEEGTHLLLVAPGAHTLAERYLASFGFPSLSPLASTESPGSTSANHHPPTEQNGHSHAGATPKRKPRGIASIRLFVDPRPQEGVYAALGMGWAGLLSPSASPVVSPTVPTFLASASGSPIAPAFAREERDAREVRGGTEAMESVGFVPGVPLPIPPTPVSNSSKGAGGKVNQKGGIKGGKGKGVGAGMGIGMGMGRSVSLPPAAFAAPTTTSPARRGQAFSSGFARAASGGAGRAPIPAFDAAPLSPTLPTATHSAHVQSSRGADSSSAGAAADAAEDPHAAPGSYITHSALGGVGAVLLRALRAGMPVWERGGDIRLLGGEFVFEWGPNPSSTTSTTAPTLRCTYAHRMQTPRGHASVARVFAAAGVHLPEPSPSPPPPTTSRLGRSKSSVSLSKAAGRRRETGPGIPRAASSLHLDASSSASAAFKHQHERAHTDGGRPLVPRSASTPATAGMFSRGGNVFTRFAGPRGGRAQTPKVDAADVDKPKDDTTATKPKDNTTATRERAQMPRSASTPPAPSGRRIGGEHHGWAHVGVIWEALGERGADGEKHEHDLDAHARQGRVREPAMKATLSASSSRPWALARAGSTGSLVDASDCEEQEQVAKIPSGSNSGSSSSCSVNISFVSPVRRTGSETTTASSSSEPVSESEVSYPPHPYPSYTYKVGKHIYDAAEVYTDPSEEADGDDERSGSDEEDIRFAFPKRRSVAYSRTYRDVGELGVGVEGDGDGEVSECGAETGHHPPHGRARSEQGYVGGGTPLARAGARKYATHAGYPSIRSRATHGHGGAETDPEEEYDDYGNVYGEGYEGDGYGGAPGDGEDAWMRARAKSLARLRARKEVRRGGGV